jgi:hypothetical protein
MANAAVPKVFGAMAISTRCSAASAESAPPNVLEILFHPDGVQPYIRNFAEVAVPLLVRTAREALEHPHVQSVLDRVLDYPTVPARWRSLDLSRSANPLPVLPTEFSRRRSPPRAVLDDDHLRHAARRHHRRAARRGVLSRRLPRARHSCARWPRAIDWFDAAVRMALLPQEASRRARPARLPRDRPVDRDRGRLRDEALLRRGRRPW